MLEFPAAAAGAGLVAAYFGCFATEGRLCILCSWPLLRTMQDAVDLHDIVLHAVDGQKGKARKCQLAGAGLTAWPASARKGHEGAYVLIDAQRYAPGGFRGRRVSQ